MNPWREHLPAERPASWRRQCLLSTRAVIILCIFGFGIGLLAMCGAAYDRFQLVAAKQQDYIRTMYSHNHRDNVTVHLWPYPGARKIKYNLGENGLDLYDQIRLLDTLVDHKHALGIHEWWLTTTHSSDGKRKVNDIALERQDIAPFDEDDFQDNYEGEDYDQDKENEESRHLDLQRMDQTVTDILDFLHIPRDMPLAKRHILPPPAQESSLPPLPSDIGGVPTHLPDEPELPTSPLPPPLDPVPTTIGPNPPNPPVPTTDLDLDTDPANLPDFIQLPFKMIGLLKRVVGRLADNRSLPEVLRKVIVLVQRLLDKILHDPEPTGPPTRPPIGKRPKPTGLPPPPPVPGPPGKKPGLPLPPAPPLPTTTKKPLLPPIPLPPLPTGPPTRPPIGKRPKPPGKGKGKASKRGESEEGMPPLSGFLEVPRRAGMARAAKENDEVGVSPPEGDEETSSKKPLSKEQRAYLHSSAHVMITEEVQKLHDKDPEDPQNALINVPACMVVFNRLARHAERWVGRNPDAEPPAPGDEVEDGWMAVGDWEDWDE